MATHASSAVPGAAGAARVAGAAGDGAGLERDGFFAACPTDVLDAGLAAVLTVAGRVVVGREDAPSEARGPAARGRLAAAVAVVVAGASDCRETALPGDARGAALAAGAARRTAGFRFSSPDVSDDRSGSASDVVFTAAAERRAEGPATGRVGGLLRLDPPSVLAREPPGGGGRVVLVEARGVADGGAAVRRALAAVGAAAEGRRGGTASLGADEGAMARAVGVVGVEGPRRCCCRRLGRPCMISSASLVAAMLGVGSGAGGRSGDVRRRC